MAFSFRRFTKRFFIILNVLLAIAFIISCYGYLFNPLYFWYVGLLTLGAAYLLIALLFFMIFWLFTNVRYMLIGIVAMLLCWQPIQHLVGFHAGKNFSLKKESKTLRVMTWNVEHFNIANNKKNPEVKINMLQTIRDYAPDIACFQEMVGSDSVAKAINYLPDFTRTLGMPYMHYSFSKKLDFDANHHFGIIIFSRLPITQVHTLSYSPNDYNSIFQYADVLFNGDTLRIFNIHLQSLKFSKGDLQYIDEPGMKEGENLSQGKGVLSKFKQGEIKRKWQSERVQAAIAKSPHPVIVCGDFNDVPNSYAYHTIGSGLQNAFKEKGFGIGRTFANISPTLRIDNVFTGHQFTFLQYTRIKRKMSDHFPLVVDIQLK